MRKIDEFATGQLLWVQPARLKQEFELRASDEVVGKLRFVAANFCRSQWDWLDAQNQPLVDFKSHQGLLKVDREVAIETAAIKSPDLPLLVVLGWYLLVLFARDAAASSAGASSAGIAPAG